MHMSNANLTHAYSVRARSDLATSRTALIFDLETRRYDAMISGDVASLEKMFANDLHYMHSNAMPDSKTDYLTKIAAGRLAYNAISASDVVIRAGDDHGLVLGHLRAEVVSDGKPRTLDCKFIAVWCWEGGTWVFKAFAPTPVPTAP
jgi:ketosteroid isomerase-like protein